LTPGTALTNQVRAAVSKVGARLFPMTVGRFYGPYHKGRRITRVETVTLNPGDILIRGGHVINVGTQGMSDLVGWVPHVVTADDVGQTIAVYVACEIKAGSDQLREGQPQFIEAVTKNGGRAGVARTPEEAVRIVNDRQE
jgi:hypothetical protein